MYRKNVASQFVCFQMLLTATGAVATGLSPAVRRCIDGTFAAGGGTVTEDGTTGSYKYAMSQADTNGNDISFIFSAATAMPVCINIVTTAADPTDSVRLGLTGLANAVPGAAGGLFIAGTNAATTITTALTTTFTGNLTGSVASVTGLTASDVGAIKTKTDFLPSVTAGAAGGVFIAGSNAATSITTALTANIIGNITGNLSGSVGSVTGAVGSVTGLTASDVGAIKTKTDFLPSVTAGAAGGLFIAGANAATSITTALTANITGNITGNLSGSVGSVTGAVGSVTGAVGSVTGNVGGNVTGSVGSVAAGGIAAASFAAGAIDATAVATGAIDADALATDAVVEIADGLLNRDMATGTDSGSSTVRTVRQALRFLRNKWTTVGIDATTATLTVTKEDDAATSWTAVVTSDSAAHPIIANDPAGP